MLPGSLPQLPTQRWLARHCPLLGLSCPRTQPLLCQTQLFFFFNWDELSLQAHSSAEAFVSARLYLICTLNVIRSRLNRKLTTLGLSLITPPLLLPVDKSTDYPNYYQGLWDCTSDLPDELSFRRGDTIYILSKVSSESLLLLGLIKYLRP